MRCGCAECGAFMIQTEGIPIKCVCPDCGVQCNACMGTNTVVARDQLAGLRNDPRFNKEEEP